MKSDKSSGEEPEERLTKLAAMATAELLDIFRQVTVTYVEESLGGALEKRKVNRKKRTKKNDK